VTLEDYTENLSSPLLSRGRLFNFDFSFSCGHFSGFSPPDFCSCLIYQAQLPNKLGNYIFKKPRRGTVEAMEE